MRQADAHHGCIMLAGVPVGQVSHASEGGWARLTRVVGRLTTVNGMRLCDTNDVCTVGLGGGCNQDACEKIRLEYRENP